MAVELSVVEDSGEMFGVDLDGVILDQTKPWFDFIENRYSESPRYEDVVSWDFSWAGFLDLDALWDYTWKTPLKLTKHGLQLLGIIEDIGFNPVFLTNRKEGAARDAAKRDLLAHGLSHYDVIFAEEKGDAALALGLIGHIDDKYENALDVGFKLGKECSLLWDTPWNQSLDIKVPYTRVSTLNDVARSLMKLVKPVSFTVH